MTRTIAKEHHSGVISIDQADIDSLLEKEWLLANSRGSYASGTIIGCNTRRYHGLLVAALHPPVERFVALSNVLEKVTIGEKSYELANFEFSDRLHPQGFRHLKDFRRGDGVHFRYQLGSLEIEKSIYLLYDHDHLIINYDFSDIGQEIEFSLLPLLALRDFHSLQSSSASLSVEQNQDNGIVTAHGLDPNGPAVHLFCPSATFKRGPDWWYAMHYRQETRRGQDDYEDIWPPGDFATTFTGSKRITVIVHASKGLERPGPMDFDIDKAISDLRSRNGKLIEQADAGNEYERNLTLAADQFIVRRGINENKQSTSILAGFHWFADWGRDAFISLPGLLLQTNRFEEAREVLETFAEALDQGMIPNRFDDYGGSAHYNSVDASLWFVNAAYQYLLASNDEQTFQQRLSPCIGQIIEAYTNGTRFDIHADDDGLINAGDSETQLTWMDARCNGVSFTPRYGKAVEINALWANALRIMAQTTSETDESQKYSRIAEKTEENFRKLFWNNDISCLNDCILPDGLVDSTIRPNQIFAVSLPFSALLADQQKMVVSAVTEHLLTPYGLRSLSFRDSRYQGHYHGDQFQRDSAYHQGTVWGYLMGPFIEAFLKVNHFSAYAKEQAREMIGPLLGHLTDDGCLGSVSEIFDGDWPHYAKGCIAQAWSVAELLRVKKLLR